MTETLIIVAFAALVIAAISIANLVIFSGLLRLALQALAKALEQHMALPAPSTTASPVPAPVKATPAAPVAPAPPPVLAAPIAPGPPPWLTLALQDVGFHEIGNNQGIQRWIDWAHCGTLGDPWCAIFANAELERSNVPGTRSPSSQSFAQSSNFTHLDAPCPGCIVVYWRGSKASGQGHVNFYLDETATHIRGVGGNQDDAVSIASFPKDSASFGLVGFYWPKSVPVPHTGAIPSSPSAGSAAPAMGAGTTVRGRMSVFGGPEDRGLGPAEGLALCEPAEIAKFPGLFLPAQPPGTTGLARRLDPGAHYLAMRWDYKATPRAWLQAHKVRVVANGKQFDAQPIDWGPAASTGRVADMSPGLATALGLQTDDNCSITIPDSNSPAGT